nr:hypothetical protein BaRGS_006462 [Batillaria attramentaria]
MAGNTGSRGSLQGVGSSAFSDASSDISDSSSVPPWAVNEGGRVKSVSGVSATSLGEGVTEHDVQQVEMFYKSHKSDVIVCHSLANLYFGSAVASSSTPSLVTSQGSFPASGSESWDFVSTGIPLLVLDSGKHHRTRQLSIVLAEKGTGFVLWRDVVSHLTRYTCPHANFHTLRVSADNNKLAGLSFDDSKAAADFAATFQQMTSDPNDDLLMLSKKGKKKKKKEESKKVKYKPPKKTDISQPCCFQHVTKLERPQMGGILPPPPPNGFPPHATSSSMSSLSDAFHDRLALSTSRARSQSSELSLASSGRSDQ